MKKIFFFEIFSFFQNVKIIVNSKKEFIMFDIEYLQNFISQKIKLFKVFQKWNFFLFSDREFYADQKCSGCLFSILGIFRVLKKIL